MFHHLASKSPDRTTHVLIGAEVAAGSEKRHAIGFSYVFLTGSRKTGPEVFGDKIWWNNLRPIHAFLYFAFAIFAILGKRWSWMILLADVIFGLTAFIIKHTIGF